MTYLVQPVILCGGSGSRLWPLSRLGYPKQFLCLSGENSLLQQAAKRLVGLSNPELYKIAPLSLVGNEEHRFIAQEQLREIGVEEVGFILEPVGRNTAPALTLAALAAVESGEDPVLVVTPADQIIADEAAFQSAINHAIKLASEGNIVILGVTPDKPETGYGYIQADQAYVQPCEAMNVLRFVEKPDAKAAQSYLNDGGYYWNAGMFVLRASVWLSAIKYFSNSILEATARSWAKRSEDSKTGGWFIRPDRDEFVAIPSESIDYAVMEQCPGSRFPIKMVPLTAGWSDLGAWDAVWRNAPKDDAGNTYVGDILAADSHNNLVHATSRLVSLVGVDDLVVVETPDAVLVINKSHSQSVKNVVNQLVNSGREEHNVHRKVYRPWGWYDSIEESKGFKVKRIMIKPGASISLQKHRHRSEHWIVVKGVADVTCGDKTEVLRENQSTYIPQGAIHRLANSSAAPLEIIEVQSGSYLGEEDIERFEDIYGRGER